MKTIFVALALLFAIVSSGQLPSLQWADKVVGTNSKSMAADASGNTYLMGNMGAGSTLDVDPGPGVYNLSGDDGTKIIYKLNTSGNLVWAKQLSSDVFLECIRVDAAENVYVTGQYQLTADFDPGAGTFNLTAVNQNDIFTLKLDPAGNFLWAKSQGGAMSDIGYSVAISAAGTVYTTGSFSGTADFDPGAGVSNMTAGVLSDSYISALDANGNFLWAKQIAGGFNGARSITTNALGNIISAGYFSGTKDFDPGAGVFNMTSAGAGDIYILKLDGAGNFIWARSVGGIGTDETESVALDPLGNVYATGRFSFTADFDPGPGTFTYTASGTDDMFILKLNVNGGFAWAKQITSPLFEVGRNIATDAAGNVYTTGIFQDLTDFDPGPGVFNLTSNGSNNIFISKLNTAGDFVWAMRFGGFSSDDRGNAIAVDASDNLYVTGNFSGQIDFDPGPGTAILLTSNTSEFLLKFGEGSVLPLTLLNFSGSAAANGTLLQWQTAQEINTKYFETEWSTDGQHYSKIHTTAAAGNSTQTLYYSYTHSNALAGINYYRLKMIDKDNQYRYSPVVTVTINNYRSAVSVFPNPVADVLQIKIAADKNEKLTLQLINAEGKAVASKIFMLVKGDNRLSWKLPGLATGNYFISSPNKEFKTIKLTRR